MIKYPKTPRLEATLRGDLHSWRKLDTVVSEKVDGANVGLSFDGSSLVLQSRGHVLTGGPRERLFDRYKSWAREREKALYEALGGRYVLFGEWLGIKHRIFYDALPSFFLVLDLYDREREHFVVTSQRESILGGLDLEAPPILHRAPFGKTHNFSQYIGPSHFKTARWKDHFGGSLEGTDDSILMEGVYVKVEDSECVVGRMKVCRPEFEKVRTDNFWHLTPNRVALAGDK